MKKLINKKTITRVVIAVIIALASVLTLTLSGGNSDFISGAENTLMRPVKSMMTSLIGSLEKIYGYMYRYDQIVAENQELKDKIAKLEEEYRDYTAISNENEQLKQLLGFASRHSEFKFEQSTIISWSASNWSSTFTIGKGSNSGIELYDSVVTENGYLVARLPSWGPQRRR